MHITSLIYHGRVFDKTYTTFSLKGIPWIRTPSGPMRVLGYTPAKGGQGAAAEVEAMAAEEVPPIPVRQHTPRAPLARAKDHWYDNWLM